VKAIARYSVNFGLEGCHMPDSYAGSYEFTTRKELAELIRDQLLSYDMPACLFREARIKRLWSFIKAHGSSTAHFRLTHKGYALCFSGLTEQEFIDAEGQD